MFLNDNLRFRRFDTAVGPTLVVFDGSAVAVHMRDGSALTPEQAMALLDAVSRTVADAGGPFDGVELPVAAAVAASEEAEAAAAPPFDGGTPVAPAPDANEAPEKPKRKSVKAQDDALAGGGDWRANVGRDKSDAAEKPAPEKPAPAAKSASTGSIPDEVLAAKRVKDVVLYYLQTHKTPDAVWEAVGPLVGEIPALARLNNPENRVRSVATAFAEG